MQRELVVGGFYRHFKNRLYQVKGIAYHSETKEKMVVYQAMYGDFALYVRPYDMFVSEVDHVKYPEVSQKYRFEQVDPAQFLKEDGLTEKSRRMECKEEPADTEKSRRMECKEEPADTEKSRRAECNEEPAYTENECVSGLEEQPDKILMDFLDIDSYREKLKYLDNVRDNLTDKVIDAMAASLDVEVSGCGVYDRYHSLKQVLAAHAKYECTRLRS